MNTTEEQTLDPLDQLEQINQDLLQRLDELTNGGLKGEISLAQHRMLSAASQYGPLSIGELAGHVGSAFSTTSEGLTRLMKSGLITKVRGPYDSRVIMVELTHEGEQQLERRRKHAHDGCQKAMRRLPPGDRGLILSVMKQLVEMLGKGAECNRRQKPRPDASEVSRQERIRSAPPVARVSARRQGGSLAVRVFSVIQVAQMCQVSNETIRRWIRKYGLVAYNTTGGLAIKITETDLREFSERMKVYVEWESGDEGD